MPRLTDAEARAVCPHDHATCDSCGEGLTGIPESRIPAFRAEPGALREALEDAFHAMDAACKWAANETAGVRTIADAERHMAGLRRPVGRDRQDRTSRWTAIGSRRPFPRGGHQ